MFNEWFLFLTREADTNIAVHSLIHERCVSPAVSDHDVTDFSLPADISSVSCDVIISLIPVVVAAYPARAAFPVFGHADERT